MDQRHDNNKIDRRQSQASSQIVYDSKIFSSPSRMRTTDLTDIFKVPSKLFPNVSAVLTKLGYEIIKEIGKGSYAVVYKARRVSDDMPMACKVLDITISSRHQNLAAKNELFIMERVQHPHIIRLYKHFIIETQRSRLVYIFMQLAECESLSIYVRKSKNGLPEQECKRILAQITTAVNHMHGKGIAHRDLKMGNVLLNSKYECLVTDFGLSRVAFRRSKGKILSNKFCGTVPYMAPEILLTKEYHIDYDPFYADIWAIGVILYCISNRGYPFNDSRGCMLEQQMSHKIKFSKKMTFHPDNNMIDLFYRLLDPNMMTRIKIEQLMVHPWIFDEVNLIEKDNVSKILSSMKKAKTESGHFDKSASMRTKSPRTESKSTAQIDDNTMLDSLDTNSPTPQ